MKYGIKEKYGYFDNLLAKIDETPYFLIGFYIDGGKLPPYMKFKAKK